MNLTQDLIDAACLSTETIRASSARSFDFYKFSKGQTPNGRTIDCELHIKAVVDDAARAAGIVQRYKTVRTQFFRGSLRISRAHAEKLLSGELA